MTAHDGNGSRNPLRDGMYLTDGGLETTLVFHRGIDLPHFAAFDLLRHDEGRRVIAEYYRPYLELARRHGLGFVLETPTWRANRDWGFKLGYTEEELRRANREAAAFMRSLRPADASDVHFPVSGNIGPRGDGYVADNRMSAEEAQAYHRPQVETFSEEKVDLVSAFTLNYRDEAIGIVRAAREAGLPVVISFTLETDGRLPNGESLSEAVTRTDEATDAYAAYYMINCAHPEHFKHRLRGDGGWKNRIGGIRANASTKSHAELDESTSLDTGDKCLLSEGYRELMTLLPEVRVIGGCCGTDHTHIEEICRAIFAGRKEAV